MQQNRLKAPFPYFGGKAMIADLVWHYLGDVKQYIEPFFGSGAVLLRRPQTQHQLYYEIVNDKDGNIANVWRAIQYKPDETAKWCDWPVNHLGNKQGKVNRHRERMFISPYCIKQNKGGLLLCHRTASIEQKSRKRCMEEGRQMLCRRRRLRYLPARMAVVGASIKDKAGLQDSSSMAHDKSIKKSLDFFTGVGEDQSKHRSRPWSQETQRSIEIKPN